MIFQFSDGEFFRPDSNITEDMEKKINSFIVIIAFYAILEKLKRNPQACTPLPPSPPPKKKKIPSRILL